jgi:hypothetical protein
LLNSTYIGTSTAMGGSMRITSSAKNRKDRPGTGTARSAIGRRHAEAHNESSTGAASDYDHAC